MRTLHRIAALVALVALAQPAEAGNTPPWFYRVFRGWRLASVSPEKFTQVLSEKFVPAAPATHAKNGLVAYVPAVPPLGQTTSVPDEIAIVVYESEEVYNKARATPEGLEYAALHWELFDKAKAKSHGARPLARTLLEDAPVDVMNCGTDWQKGHTTVFIGERSPGAPRESFLAQLTDHVVRVRDAFRGQGLDGYIVVATPDQEIAFMHWKSKDHMDKAMAGPDGKEVREDAAKLMKTVMWADATPFNGKIDYGQAVTVQFERRKP